MDYSSRNSISRERVYPRRVVVYASPTWWGFTSAYDRERLELLVRIQITEGFLPQDSSSFPISPLWQKLLMGDFSRRWSQVRTTSCRTCCRPRRKPDTVSDQEHILTSCHSRTLVLSYIDLYGDIYC